MPNKNLDTETVRNLLIEAYGELSPIDQAIVQLFSVIYEPVNRATFAACFSSLGFQDKRGYTFNASSLRPHLEHLLKNGVLIQDVNQGPQCHPLLVEIATRDLTRTGKFDRFVQAVRQTFPVRNQWSRGPMYFTSERQLIREVRIAIYGNKPETIPQLFDTYNRYGYRREPVTMEDVIHRVFKNPFDAEWFSRLPHSLFETGIASMMSDSLLNLKPMSQVFDLLYQHCTKPEGDRSHFLDVIFMEHLLLSGRFADARRHMERLFDAYGTRTYRDEAMPYEGWLNVLEGDYDKAINYMAAGLKAFRKAQGKKKFFNGLPGLFYVLALIKQGDSEHLKEAHSCAMAIAKKDGHWLQASYQKIINVIKVLQGDLSNKDLFAAQPLPSVEKAHSIETLVSALCLYWVDIDKAKQRLPKVLNPFYDQARESGYDWLALQAAELVAQVSPRSNVGKKLESLREPFSDAITRHPLVALVQPKEAWELCLNALTSLRKDSETIQHSPGRIYRLAWFLTLYPTMGFVLQPREQKITKGGGWSKGRPIALKRLASEQSSFNYLTPQDLRICAHIEADSGYYYGPTQFTFGDRVFLDLAGHPHVFWEDSPTTRVEIVKAEPELLVKKKQDGWLSLAFSPPIDIDKDLLITKETPTRLKVIDITDEHRHIAQILGAKNQLDVPVSAQERVLDAIGAVSRLVTVHSDIGGDVQSAEEVEADPSPHLHLLPTGGGLKVALLVRPFAEGGPYYRPGKGGGMVIGEVQGKRLQTTRDLGQETTLADEVLNHCSILNEAEEYDGEWIVEEPEDCLELLLEIQQASNALSGHESEDLEEAQNEQSGPRLVVEWPEGERFRVSPETGVSSFRLNINRQRDWFAASGELQVSDDQVLDMQRLMELLEQSPGRFVALGDGQFLALTQEFRKRLDDLRAYSEKSGKGYRFHPLASLAMEDWMDEVGDLKADKHWKEHLQKFKDLQHFQPELPSTLQAELRDYQIEGFQWLARLAHWGVGGCLADDMGLGKTLQALAVILTRAPDGATLIVAPTSVCANWISEAEKFAPTLNPIQFGSGDRQKLLDSLQPFDMLVCSYGLLQQEDVAGMLAQVEWQTIVLDEAQAIKNMATKRSKAAMNLQGGFKVITTGTPIENHLGELWNQFRFINPGLLGSLEQFNQKFANPIERYQDKQARNRLKKLIQPFILRRTKSEVLDELPSRTEVTLHVELSKNEMAFYEALRREAIESLSESDAAAGAKHLQVLAAIMRLRRACCNAKLVTQDTPLPSAKLEVFGEILDELLGNNHKALVFSQFVDHLTILREYLDEREVSYQYLDGSTPAKARKQRVNAFQAGEGDVFLISLKAGGTGLNLTAADYVIHMDPWWNPAVEDQASDRAHRIGQQRPVTIYRLVAKGTIEDKIVDLHRQKRDLADSLLEGADMSGKMSTDELLKLIHEE